MKAQVAVVDPLFRQGLVATLRGEGIALVRHFVVREGGTIDVASPGAGQGTTFTVRIPARPA